MKTKTRLHVAAVFVANMAGVGPSIADDSVFFFTPRFWYSLVSDKRFARDGGAEQSTSFVMPLYGGTISFIPKDMGGISFHLNMFSGAARGSDYLNIDSVGNVFQGDLGASRLDIEGIFQRSIGPGGANWSLGIRYVNVLSDINGVDQSGQLFRFREDAKIFLGEFGLGLSSPLDSAGNHRFFGGVTAGIGYKGLKDQDQCCAGIIASSRSAAGGVFAFDANAGYAFNLSPTVTFTARYRLIAISGQGFSFVQQTQFVHGPEINLSIKMK
jgi:hypothetical protein